MGIFCLLYASMLLPLGCYILYCHFKWVDWETSNRFYPDDIRYFERSKAKDYGLTLGEWKKDRYAFKMWSKTDMNVPFDIWVETCITNEKRMWWRRYKNCEVSPGYPGEICTKRGVDYVPKKKRRWFR